MLTEKQEHMFSLVEQWRASGMTQKQFCKKHQVKLATFGYWNTRYRRRQNEQSGGFVQVASSSSSQDIEIIYPNGVRLSLSSDSGSWSMIGQLIHVW